MRRKQKIKKAKRADKRSDKTFEEYCIKKISDLKQLLQDVSTDTRSLSRDETQELLATENAAVLNPEQSPEEGE